MRKDLNKFQRCPWCWNFSANIAIKQVITELNISKKDLVIVSGIGCSGKMSQYIDGYWIETLHGRILPFATWMKLSNPKLTIIAYGWDGDGYGIWLSHFIHTCNRNIDITYIVSDNQNYALTTWQASPTTPEWTNTKSTPEGKDWLPIDPIRLAEVSNCYFTKQVSSTDLKEMKETIKNWILHKWFSHINVVSSCPTFKKW